MTHRDKNDKWRVQWYDHGRRRSKTFPNKALAAKFEAHTQLRRHEPVITPKSDLTFAAYSTRWLENYCKLEKAESQWAEDERTIKNHLLAPLGAIKLKDLRKADLESVKQELSKKRVGRKQRPLKPKTINNVLQLAKKMLSTAVDWDLLTDKPFGGVKRIKVGDQPFDFWKIDELQHFVRFAGQIDPEFTQVVTLAAHTGLRWGELGGLKRSEMDFSRRMIRVRLNYNFKLQKLMTYTKNREIKEIPMNDVVF